MKTRFAKTRAKKLGLTLPASHKPKALNPLQIDSFLNQARDHHINFAEIYSNCARDEVGVDPMERQFVESSLEHEGFALVIDSVRGTLLDPVSHQKLLNELAHAAEVLLARLPEVFRNTTINTKHVRGLIRAARKAAKNEG